VSCAAALANIEVMLDERLPENADARGSQILSRFAEFKERCALIGDVRGKGLMIGLELVSDSEKTPAAAQAVQVRRLCRESGIMVGVGGSFGNVVRIQPPLVITEEDANRICSTVEKACSEAASEL
jgi:4-aminobutyrate aminotransferase-like enzyme